MQPEIVRARQSDFVKDGGTPCFFQEARSRMLSADVLVLNHTLFFTLLGGLEEEAGGRHAVQKRFRGFRRGAHGRTGRLAPHRLERFQRAGALRAATAVESAHREGLLAVLRRGKVNLVAEALKESEKFFAAVEKACDEIAAARERGAARGNGWNELRIRRCDLVAGQRHPADRNGCAKKSAR